jgi:hypothetical protein
MIMKKIVSSIFIILLMIGVSGCMKQPTSEENKANEKRGWKDKYNQKFTPLEYILAKHVFNDSENVLIAQSSEGILVNVKEKLSKIGKFYSLFHRINCLFQSREKLFHS